MAQGPEHLFDSGYWTLPQQCNVFWFWLTYSHTSEQCLTRSLYQLSTRMRISFCQSQASRRLFLLLLLLDSQLWLLAYIYPVPSNEWGNEVVKSSFRQQMNAKERCRWSYFRSISLHPLFTIRRGAGAIPWEESPIFVPTSPPSKHALAKKQKLGLAVQQWEARI